MHDFVCVCVDAAWRGLAWAIGSSAKTTVGRLKGLAKCGRSDVNEIFEPLYDEQRLFKFVASAQGTIKSVERL